jgi:DNA glycosylase AlkZ-like
MSDVLPRVGRDQIIAYRRRAQALDERLPPGSASLRRAASAGLQDSVPRSALHALHARVRDVGPNAWEDPALVQVWGPRYTAYVVPEGEHAPFTLGRLPGKGQTRERALDVAARLDAYLDGRTLRVEDAASGLGVHHHNLRYASLSGTVLMRWGGARQPTLWTVPCDVDPTDARLELVRRYLHIHGPSTLDAFVRWGGVDRSAAAATFAALSGSLVEVRTPVGDAQLMADDEPALREPAGPAAPARLLPSGDPFYLCWGADRDLLVPDARRRDQLWTPRVWPGALLLRGEIAGTWRRAGTTITVTPWRAVTGDDRAAVEAEAAAMPLPEVTAPATVLWAGVEG